MKNKRNKEQLMKVSNGITLIALVITIIVLLILAGVAIATLTGENGVLTKAKSAQTQTEQAKEDENLKIAIAGSYGPDGKLNLKDLKDNLENQEISYTDSDAFPLEVTVNGGEIEIKQDGTIEEVFDAEEWDKTATPEDCFMWASNTKGEEGYDIIIGYTENLQSYTKVRIPSRCRKIICDGSYYDSNEFSDEQIGRAFFSNVEKVELPNTIEKIGVFAFGNVHGSYSSVNIALKEINIPNSVTSIDGKAFTYCKNLEQVTIPNSVTSIGQDIFLGCSSLKTINIKGHSSAPSGWGSNWNYGCSATINWNQ